MAQKKVFGKRGNAQHTAFASMLNSSPEVCKAPTAATNTEQNEVTLSQAAVRRSPRRPKSRVLQTVSGNVSVLPAQQLSAAFKRHTECDIDTRTIACSNTRRPKNDRYETTRRPSDALKDLDAVKADKLTKPHDEDIYKQHCQPLLELGPTHIEPFSSWAARVSEHLDITKIAEASYGEVYRLSVRPGPECDSSIVRYESVLKIIPLKPPQSTVPTSGRERSKILKRIGMMSKPEDVSSEVRLLQRMSMIPGFTDFRELSIVQGRPPPVFVEAYQAYNKTQATEDKEPSTYPDPTKKASYRQIQLWAVIEMSDAGTDLERLVAQGLCNDIWSVWDIFWQVTLALAKGEDAAEFEHRDLHLGNVCVQRKEDFKQRQGPDIASRKLGFTNLDITLIDYTVSRASMANTGEIAYIDLAKDEWLFTADSTYEYQYDIYRYMRSALFYDDPLAEFEDGCKSRSWSQHHPQTNLVWLHYLLYTLLEQTQNEQTPSKSALAKKQAISRWKESKKLKKVLLKVNDLLSPESMIRNGIASAGALVATALENAWLDEKDVIGDEDSELMNDLLNSLVNLHA